MCRELITQMLMEKAEDRWCGEGGKPDGIGRDRVLVFDMDK